MTPRFKATAGEAWLIALMVVVFQAIFVDVQGILKLTWWSLAWVALLVLHGFGLIVFHRTYWQTRNNAHGANRSKGPRVHGYPHPGYPGLRAGPGSFAAFLTGDDGPRGDDAGEVPRIHTSRTAGSSIEVGEILALRVWKVEDRATLRSGFVGTPWPQGETFEHNKHGREAWDIYGGGEHAAGVHAWKHAGTAAAYAYGLLDEAVMFDDERIAVGIVALWGKVAEHIDGWRAEFAYPVRIIRVMSTSIIEPFDEAAAIKALNDAYSLSPGQQFHMELSAALTEKAAALSACVDAALEQFRKAHALNELVESMAMQMAHWSAAQQADLAALSADQARLMQNVARGLAVYQSPGKGIIGDLTV